MQKGNWIASIATPSASFIPCSISISDGEKVVLNNISHRRKYGLLPGKVNMEMPLERFFGNNPVLKANETIAMAGQKQRDSFRKPFPKLRLWKPQETVKGMWQECTPKMRRAFSATAYHFAQTLLSGIKHTDWDHRIKLGRFTSGRMDRPRNIENLS